VKKTKRKLKRIQENPDLLDAIEGIRRGLEDIKAGRTKPAFQVHEEMRKKYGIEWND